MADDFRDRLAKAAEELTEEGIEVLRGVLDRKQLYACRKCGFKNQYPDVRALTDALKFLNDYGKGKPAMQRAPVEEKKIESKKLEDLSDDELFELLDKLEDTSGKTVSGGQKEAAG